MRISCLLSLFLLSTYQPMFAGRPLKDSLPQWSVEASYTGGMVLKHTSNMQVDPKGYAQGWEVGFAYQSSGAQYWNRALNYPALGISFGQILYPNRDTLGMATGILPHLRFSWLRRSNWEAYVRLGIGLAMLNKRFDDQNLPSNNVFSTGLNNWSQIRLGVQYQFLPHWALQLNATYNHISNGGVKIPNLGANNFGGGLSLAYQFSERGTTLRATMPVYNKNAYWLRFGWSIRERSVWDEIALFNTYNISGGYMRNTSLTNRLLMGIQAGYDGFNRQLYRKEFPEHVSQSTLKASHMSFVVGDEIMIGQLGLMAMLGIYTYYPEFKPDWMYYRLGINLYSKPLSKTRHNLRFFIGLTMKAHSSTAEHVEVATGFTF
jgi:hypothetical protein